MVDYKRVSIILVTFNSQKTIKALLESIYRLDYRNLELIVVDNGSIDATSSIIREALFKLKEKIIVKFFKLRRNIGFCSAANIAVQNSSGEFLLFIDHDVELTPLVVQELVTSLEYDKNIGAAEPKVVNAYNRLFIDAYDINQNGSIYGLRAAQYKCSRKILYPIGACFITRKETFLYVGRFYDDFFMELHDVDFGWRLYLLGYTVKSIPTVEIYHYRGTLRKDNQINSILEYNNFKNLVAMVLQNFEAKNLVKYLLRLIPTPFFNLLYKPSKGYSQIKSFFWVILHLKLIMKRRFIIQSSRKIGDNELIGMLYSFFSRAFLSYQCSHFFKRRFYRTCNASSC